MAGKHPIYSYEYDIEINTLEHGLERFIDLINKQNEKYRTESQIGFKYDILHYDVHKNTETGIFIITVKLFYTYSNAKDYMLIELIQKNNIEVLRRRIY